MKRLLPMPGSLFLIFLLCIFSANICQAQTDTTADPDRLFFVARELANKGQRQQSRAIAFSILEKYPSYLDVKTFIGRTYAWDKKYDSARLQFAAVATMDAKTLDNYLAWIDSESWASQYTYAFEVTATGLHNFPGNIELLYHKAKLLAATGNRSKAFMLADSIQLGNATHQPSKTLLQQLRGNEVNSSVAAGFTNSSFTKYYNPMQFMYVQLSRVAAFGSVIGRVNYTSRAGKNSFQPEVDIYPRLFKNSYAYFNYGFSNGDLFPKHRAGAEFFTSLPHSMEASLGMRYLYFNRLSTVTFFTGSFGYYTGNYWLSLRPNITPDSGSTSVSASFTARRYLKSAEKYLSLRIGAGFSPELLNFQSASGAVSKSFYTVKSQNAGVGYQHLFGKKWIGNFGLDIIHQEVPFAIGEYIFNYSFSTSLKYFFR